MPWPTFHLFTGEHRRAPDDRRQCNDLRVSDSDVSCREELSSKDEVEAKAAAAPPPAKPKSEAPSGGAGFALGENPGAAQLVCEGAGKTWDGSQPNRATCSGPAAELGFAADITLDFCKQRTCAITIRHRP